MIRGKSSVVRIVLITLTGLMLTAACASEPPQSSLEKINLPSGFSISTYAEGVPNARSMALSPDQTLYVATRRAGNVYAVRDDDGDNRADRVFTIASGLTMPNGVEFREGALYVAEVNRVLRYDGIEGKLENPPSPVVLNDTLPTETHHGWKYLRFGPYGKLYFNIGAPCNICEPGDPYGSIVRMNPDGTGLEVFARGVRNSVGFDWHPESGDLWFTDNGRDNLGDDVPPDELNRASEAGMHFGYPYCHGQDIADPEFGRSGLCAEYQPAAQNLGPHVAAIGMTFYTGDMFPDEYRNQIFIAEHGSWNRSVPIGYRLTLVRLEGNKVVSYQPFAEGWLEGDEDWGRPADVLEMPDGSLLLSDDTVGAIYRITYEAER